ncbi:MAG: exodeoxyribonuclease VII small subunit [Tepidanaerobacteraceae bacterium]|nr:exodeoxyribonuclease VII small subunit [Tepidanaerobacteraceae bacterium]
MNSTYKYEEALNRLEYIADQLEKGDLTLEEALTFFEEGIKLVKICSNMLDQAEGKIQVLIKDLDGELLVKDYKGGSEIVE